MAKFWETRHAHPFSWDHVARAYWHRYPNPNSQHVFSTDLIECRVRDDGVLYAKRFVFKTNKLPSWGRHFFSAKRVPLIEEILVDPRTKTLTTYTRNIGLRYFMGTTEKVEFRPDETEPWAKTSVKKQVWIESDVYGFQSAIKKFGVDRFKKNCIKATEGFDWVLRKMYLRSEKVCENAEEVKSGGHKRTQAQFGNANPKSYLTS